MATKISHTEVQRLAGKLSEVAMLSHNIGHLKRFMTAGEIVRTSIFISGVSINTDEDITLKLPSIAITPALLKSILANLIEARDQLVSELQAAGVTWE